MEFQAHTLKQERALLSQHKITCCGTGIQWGKTTLGVVRLLIKTHEYTAPDDHFIVTSPTTKILKQSTLPALLKVFRGRGEWKAGDQEFHIYGGGKIYVRTGHLPDSVVGITNVRHILCDEAGKYGLYFWENIQGRAAFKDCQIDLVTSPYALNWIFKDIIRPKMKDPTARPDVLLVQARSDENPHFPQDFMNRQRLVMDPRRFNAMFGGVWSKMSGLVYDCFDENDNQCDPITLPTGTRIVAGVDWGFTNPCAIVIRAITPSGHHFQISELYESGLTIDSIIEHARRMVKVHKVQYFWCGPDEPGYIQKFNEAGLPAAAWDASPGSVRSSIDDHYELIRSGRYKIWRGTGPKTIDEYETYHYPEPKDLKTDEDEKEQGPVKQNDHAMDANRGVTRMEIHEDLRRKAEEKVRFRVQPHETQIERLERLKKGIPRTVQTEDWD